MARLRASRGRGVVLISTRITWPAARVNYRTWSDASPVRLSNVVESSNPPSSVTGLAIAYASSSSEEQLLLVREVGWPFRWVGIVYRLVPQREDPHVLNPIAPTIRYATIQYKSVKMVIHRRNLLTNSIFFGIILSVCLRSGRVFRKFLRRKRNLCVYCGYSVSGLPSGVCPECGKSDC